MYDNGIMTLASKLLELMCFHWTYCNDVLGQTFFRQQIENADWSAPYQSHIAN